MSIEVAPDALAEAVDARPLAYLLTVGARARPHVRGVRAAVADGIVRVSDAGRTSRADVAADAAVTLLCPPAEPTGHTLIVDGTATVVGDRIDVVPVRAVLHRSAPLPSAQIVRLVDGACASDCVEL